MTRMTQLMKMKYLELITVQKYLHLKNPLETNVVYNVYKNNVRIDDPNYGTANRNKYKCTYAKYYWSRTNRNKFNR